MNSIKSLLEEGKGDDFISHSFSLSFNHISLVVKQNGIEKSLLFQASTLGTESSF